MSTTTFIIYEVTLFILVCYLQKVLDEVRFNNIKKQVMTQLDQITKEIVEAKLKELNKK